MLRGILTQRQIAFLALVILSGLLTSGCTGSFQAQNSSIGLSSSSQLTEAHNRFQAAKSVLNSSCVSCHSAGGQASYASFDVSDENHFVAKGWLVPGDEDASSILNRTIHYSGSAASVRNMPSGTSAQNFTIEDYNTLKNWVLRFGKDTQPGAVEQFQCTNDQSSGKTKSHILSSIQYKNAIEDLFGSAALQAAAGPLSSLQNVVHDTDTHERKSLVDAALVDSFSQVAEAVSQHVVSNVTLRNLVFGSCASATTPTATCIDSYLNGFAKRILRRPLTPAEMSFSRTLANRSGSYLVNIASVLSYHLQSPFFLWQIELGQANPDASGVASLTQFEIATRIAFLTTDSVPDLALFQAAEQGQLTTLTQIRSHTQRLLKSPRGQDKIARAFTWWAMGDRVRDLSGLPAQLLSGVNMNGIEQAMTSEMQIFVKELIFKDNASLYDLMTSKKSFASHTGLSSVYGHSPISAGGHGLFLGRRQGLLMRASFLTHDTFRSSIIHRGVDFQKRFLCNSIPAPSVDIADDRNAHVLTDSQLLVTTNRDAVAYQTQSPVCMTCHATINPTGFAFENFDSLGRMRATEQIFDSSGNYVRQLSVNTATDVPMPGGQSVSVQDAFDLVNHVATASEGSACATRNIYRFVNESLETAENNCELKRAHAVFSDTTKPILEALTELIAHEHVHQKVY